MVPSTPPIEDVGAAGAGASKLRHGDVSHGGGLGVLVAMVLPPVLALAAVLAAPVLIVTIVLVAALATSTCLVVTATPLAAALLGPRLRRRVLTRSLHLWLARLRSRVRPPPKKHHQQSEPTDAPADEQILLLIRSQRHVSSPS
jgi:hypothetical protein